MNTDRRRKQWWYGSVATAVIIPLTLGGISTVAWAQDDAAGDLGVSLSSVEGAPAQDAPQEAATEAVEAVEEGPSRPSEPEAVRPSEPESGAVGGQTAPLLPEPAATSTNDPQEPVPTVTFTVPDPVPGESWYDDTVQVVITANSRISDIEYVTWESTGAQPGGATVDGGRAVVTVSAQGSTRLSAFAADGEGYVSETVDVLIKIDRTPPTIDVSAPWVPGAHRFGTPIEIEYVCADPESGIDRTNIDQCGIDFSLDGAIQGGGYTGSTWTPRREGRYEVFAYARNNSGLTTRISLGMLNVLPDESVPPVVIITAPTLPGSGWYQQPIELGFQADDAGAGVDYLEYRVGAAGAWGEWVRVVGNGTSVGVGTSGIQTYQVRAADYFGNVSEPVERTVSVDVIAPVVDVTGPADGTHVAVGEELLLSYTCSDALSGIASCGGTAESGGPLDTSEPGSFEAVVIATDQAGNRTEVRRSYLVDAPDTEGPTVTVTREPVPASGWYTQSSVPFAISAEDPSGVANLHWLVTYPDGQVGEGSTLGNSEDGLAVAQQGTTIVEVWATDALGNDSDRQSFTFKLDNVAPTVWVDSPETTAGILVSVPELSLGDTVALEFACSDASPGSGVASCESSVGDTLPTDVLGTHDVTLTAVDAAGLRTVETFRYTVVEPAEQPTQQPAAAPGLARTGVDPGTPLVFGGALLVAGVLALMVGVLRRRA